MRTFPGHIDAVEPPTTLTRFCTLALRCCRNLLGLGLATLLVACSGGAGGDDPDDGGGGGGGRPGVLQVTVKDTFGAAVPGATVLGVLSGDEATGTTGPDGVAMIAINWISGSADVKVTRDTFVDATMTVAINEGSVNTLDVTLTRTTAPAGGFLATRSGGLASLDPGRSRLTFEIELIVVDGAAAPVTSLDVSAFALKACTPDAATPQEECLRSTAGDLGYSPVAAAPASVQVIPGGTVRPYAAALLMDQSGSIATSDPTGARLFAAKAMLSTLGADDRVLLSAFASGPLALIASQPLTIYPPFRSQADATGYFNDLDALGPLVGGETPLYTAVDGLVDEIVADPALPSTLARAIVVITDGDDSECGTATQCKTARDATIANAVANDVRLFTIGLSDGVDVEALGELAKGTGGALLFAETAEQLLPLYGTVGRLLSLSLPTYRMSWSVDAAPGGTFPSGSLLKGRVTVSAGGSTFDVPFVVGVP